VPNRHESVGRDALAVFVSRLRRALRPVVGPRTEPAVRGDDRRHLLGLPPGINENRRTRPESMGALFEVRT
jgi:hypothetical protein